MAGIHPDAVYCKIIEQPAPNAVKFRYPDEKTPTAILPGINSRDDCKTFLTIEVCGCKNRSARVVVSCVTLDAPYKPHPFKLVGGEQYKYGVGCFSIPANTMRLVLDSVRIERVKQVNNFEKIVESLRERQAKQVDPFKSGFKHIANPSQINLTGVRLCFQVFFEDADGKFTLDIPPAVSEPIYDKGQVCQPVIRKLSHYSASVCGGQEVILLCDRVKKDDIQIRFYEAAVEDGVKHVAWEAPADFKPSDVHNGYAISFRTPAYRSTEVTEPVKCLIELQRKSDGFRSQPRDFELIPSNSAKSLNRCATINKSASNPVLETAQNVYSPQLEHWILSTLPATSHSFRPGLDNTSPQPGAFYFVPHEGMSFFKQGASSHAASITANKDFFQRSERDAVPVSPRPPSENSSTTIEASPSTPPTLPGQSPLSPCYETLLQGNNHHPNLVPTVSRFSSSERNVSMESQALSSHAASVNHIMKLRMQIGESNTENVPPQPPSETSSKRHASPLTPPTPPGRLHYSSYFEALMQGNSQEPSSVPTFSKASSSEETGNMDSDETSSHAKHLSDIKRFLMQTCEGSTATVPPQPPSGNSFEHNASPLTPPTPLGHPSLSPYSVSLMQENIHQAILPSLPEVNEHMERHPGVQEMLSSASGSDKSMKSVGISTPSMQSSISMSNYSIDENTSFTEIQE